MSQAFYDLAKFAEKIQPSLPEEEAKILKTILSEVKKTRNTYRIFINGKQVRVRFINGRYAGDKYNHMIIVGSTKEQSLIESPEFTNIVTEIVDESVFVNGDEEDIAARIVDFYYNKT